MTFARDERRGLVETMRSVGPDAPTLCGGWTTRDLAAHLILRERRMDASAGIMIPALQGRAKRVQDQIATREWEALLADVASGPPLWSPMWPLDPLVNGMEFYAHHEDVRRAQEGWQPREFSAEQQRAMRGFLRTSVFSYRHAPVRVELVTPDGWTVVANRRRTPAVRLVGQPSELLLHAIGRNQVVLEADGAAEDIAALNASSRAI